LLHPGGQFDHLPVIPCASSLCRRLRQSQKPRRRGQGETTGCRSNLQTLKTSATCGFARARGTVQKFARSLGTERGGHRNNCVSAPCFGEKNFSSPLPTEKPVLSSRKPKSSKLIRRQMVEDPGQPKLGKWGGPRVRGQQGAGSTLKRG